MSDLSQESPLWREWAESRHSVQQMREEIGRLRAGNAELVEALKALFWDPEDAVVQYHPPQSMYVNHHPYCLHLWRPLQAELPLPPEWMVGPKS